MVLKEMKSCAHAMANIVYSVVVSSRIVMVVGNEDAFLNGQMLVDFLRISKANAESTTFAVVVSSAIGKTIYLFIA